MPLRFDLYRRLEPVRPALDLDRGFRAQVHDPAWFLARQWQLGEHQGEDAGSPVMISYVATQVPIDPLDGDPAMDPRITPPEAIVESEPKDWWTLGRRIRIGRAASAHLAAGLPPAQDAALRLGDLAPPYDRFSGEYDGHALWADRVALALPDADFTEVPTLAPVDLWDPAELVYGATFTTGGGQGPTLDVPRHDGGDLDWYSVRATTPGTPATTMPAAVEVFPNRLNYPGAPNPRWWQIEDARVDIGGFPPDRSHLATMLLIDLVMSHADDWFTFPIATTAGTVVTVASVQVRDTFGDLIDVTPPADWSLFAVDGLPSTSLVIWPTVATPLNGPALDEITIGVDEDANLLWAIERRVGGRELAPPSTDPVPEGPPPTGQLNVDDRKRYAYTASSSVPAYWHPYEIASVAGRRRFVQGRLADLNTRPPSLMPAPVSDLLVDPAAPAAGPVHELEPAAIPTNGLRLERRYVLGRSSDGNPVLWRQRRRIPLLSAPVSGLRFDILEQQVTLTP